jgi:ubiquitin carboxyl-terminal hydrolase 5/13
MPTEVAEEEWVEPDLPMEVVHELMEMGIPENQAKHSVFNAGLNSGSEAAILWFYENIENLSIQGPLVVKKKAAKKGAVKEVDPESLMMIESMGFSAKQAKRALRKCDGNLERAMDWIFSHMDDPDSDNEMQVDFS